MVRICEDPSAEELEAARKLVSGMSKDEQKKGLANMSYWLKTTGDADKTTGVRGALRQEWFVQFMVMKAREKSAKAETVASRKHTMTSSKHSDTRWMSKFALQKEIGEVKAGAWIASDKLHTRPDPITGADTEWMREYKVAFDGGKVSEENTHQMMLSVAADAKPDVIEETSNTMHTLGAASSGSGGEPHIHIKQERPDPQPLLSNPTQNLQRVQSQIIELKSMRCQAENMKYADNLMKDMDKLIAALKKTVKSLEALAVNPSEKADEKALQKLKDAVDNNDKTYKELLEWGQKFGISVLQKNAAKKRRRAA